MPMEDMLRLNEDLIRKVRVSLSFFYDFIFSVTSSMLSSCYVFLVIPTCPEILNLIFFVDLFTLMLV